MTLEITRSGNYAKLPYHIYKLIKLNCNKILLSRSLLKGIEYICVEVGTCYMTNTVFTQISKANVEVNVAL